MTRLQALQLHATSDASFLDLQNSFEKPLGVAQLPRLKCGQGASENVVARRGHIPTTKLYEPATAGRLAALAAG